MSSAETAAKANSDRVVADDGDDEGACEWCSEVGQLWVIGVWTETDDAEGPCEVDTWLCNRCAEGYLRKRDEDRA